MIFCITQITEILLCFVYFTVLTSKQNPGVKNKLNPCIFKEQIFSIDISQLWGSQSEGNLVKSVLHCYSKIWFTVYKHVSIDSIRQKYRSSNSCFFSEEDTSEKQSKAGKKAEQKESDSCQFGIKSVESCLLSQLVLRSNRVHHESTVFNLQIPTFNK